MNQSIRSRFSFSLFTNLSKAVITFGTGMLVARGLGPEQYGTMMFLLGTFTALRQVLDMGTSTAFFTFLSQRKRSKRFVGWYFAWLGVQFALTLLTVGLLFPASWIELVWKGEQRNLVILAFLAAYIQSVLWPVILQMGESQRLTRWVQGVALTVALTHFLLITFAWLGGWMGIHTVFGLMIVEWAISVALIVKQLRFPLLTEETDTIKSVFQEFWQYCRPLVIYSWLGFAYDFTDRWLLQTYAGSVHQAFYAVAFQFSAIAAIATSSIINIFWKEIAEAHHQDNRDRVVMLYRKVSRGLFFVSAAGAGFLTPWAEDILCISLGSAYVGGAATLMIMFFYPMHQSMGQIGSAMAFATGRVAAHVKIGMAFMAISIVVTYFVLASANAPIPGLGMGSLGLAAKMVVVQILSVNALAFYLSRSLGMKFDWLYQPVTALISGSVGGFSYVLSQNFVWVDSVSYKLAIYVVFYFLLTAFILYKLPWLIGMRRNELMSLVNRAFMIFR